MTENQKSWLQQCGQLYKNELTTNILPFWLKYGLDKENGGVYTCLDRDGTLYDTTKSVWFQGRFGYTMSYAYNNIEKNEAWKAAALSAIQFSEKHCFDDKGHMYFEVKADGTPLRKRRYVFSEAFAVIALAEYARLTGEQKYADRALEIFESINKMLSTPGFLPAKFEPHVQMRGHSITMIMINTALTLHGIIPSEKSEAIMKLAIERYEDLIRYFLKPEFKALLETVDMDGKIIDTSLGRTINPGHCIETAWFLMSLYEANPQKRILDDALQILDWSWDWGWDEQYGGIINFKDCKNFPHQDYSQDMKFWWPQCETIIANLYAYKLSKDPKYLERHKLVHDWTFAHFPDPEYGEWYGYLHRDGTVAQPAKGNIFKGPFHIPRMLVKSHLLCNEILNA